MIKPALNYRADIDGLRALAVLGVILFHAFPTALPGGFVGVDVFFVISGYLISGIILDQRARGAFSVRDFYFRRVRRIFPALIIVLAATLIAGWLFLFDDEFAAMGREIAAGAGFAANILFWREAGYFDRAAELKSLLHLWSLGVEEQFYFVWPFLLMLCTSRGRMIVLFTTVFTASMILNLCFVRHHSEAVFYLPFSRLWEFVAGAAVLQLNGTDTRTVTRNALSLAGIVLLAGAMFCFNSHIHYPGRAGIVPVLGAALLIHAGPGAWFNRVVLARPAVVWIGLVSYPLYLWHYPLISFLHIFKVANPLAYGISIALSFVLASATYVFLEKNVRLRPASRIAPALCSLCLLLFLAGAACLAGYIKPRLDNPAYNNVLAAGSDWVWPPPSMQKLVFAPADVFYLQGTRPEEVLYIGDSNMQQYAVRIAAVIQSGKPTYGAAFITQSGCRPIPHVAPDTKDGCFDIEDNVLRYIQSHRVKRVVIAGRWSFFSSELYYRFPKDNYVPLSDVSARSAAVESFRSFITALEAHGAEVSVLQNIPTGFNGRETVNTTQARFDFASDMRNALGFDPSIAKSAVVDKDTRRIIDDIASSTGAHVIDPIVTLCGADSCPLLYDGDKFIYKDEKHLTAGYVARYATFMDDTVLDKQKAP